eukprot:1021337-Pleurochrysis_carterae.AAC.1
MDILDHTRACTEATNLPHKCVASTKVPTNLPSRSHAKTKQSKKGKKPLARGTEALEAGPNFWGRGRIHFGP